MAMHNRSVSQQPRSTVPKGLFCDDSSCFSYFRICVLDAGLEVKNIPESKSNTLLNELRPDLEGSGGQSGKSRK